MMPTRISTDPPTCPYCGEAFTPRQPAQRFCHAKHRSAYHNAERKRLADLGAALAPRRVRLRPGETLLVEAETIPKETPP